MRTRYIDGKILLLIAENMPYVSRGVFLLSYYTGVRVSDSVSATVGSFDESGFYHYKAHKTGKNGRYKVPQSFIDDYVPCKAKPDEYIFRGRKTKTHIARQTVYNHVKTACKRLGINPAGIAPHTARKSFAVEKFRRDGLGATMAALQHRDAGTTLLYALSDDPLPDLVYRLEKLEKVVEALADKLLGDDTYTLTKPPKSDKKAKKSR